MRRLVKTVLEANGWSWKVLPGDENKGEGNLFSLADLKARVGQRYSTSFDQNEKYREEGCSPDKYDYLEFSDYLFLITKFFRIPKKKSFASIFPSLEFVKDRMQYLGSHRNAFVAHARETPTNEMAGRMEAEMREVFRYVKKSPYAKLVDEHEFHEILKENLDCIDEDVETVSITDLLDISGLFDYELFITMDIQCKPGHNMTGKKLSALIFSQSPKLKEYVDDVEINVDLVRFRFTSTIGPDPVISDLIKITHSMMPIAEVEVWGLFHLVVMEKLCTVFHTSSSSITEMGGYQNDLVPFLLNMRKYIDQHHPGIYHPVIRSKIRLNVFFSKMKKYQHVLDINR